MNIWELVNYLDWNKSQVLISDLDSILLSAGTPGIAVQKLYVKKDLKNYQIEDEKFIYHSSSEDDFCGKCDKYKQLDEFKKYLNNFVLWYKDINQKYKLEKIQKDFKWKSGFISRFLL